MFRSKIVSQVMTWLEVEEHRVTFPYQPSAHGIVERANREVIAHIKTLMLEVPRFHVGSWDATITWVARIMNARRNRSTGFAPYVLLFGRQLISEIRRYKEFSPFCKEVESRILPSRLWQRV
mgnify:CR=1 FL=1